LARRRLELFSRMNYLSHAIEFLDRPLFMASTGVPDMLSVIDRKVRIRRKALEPFFNDTDPAVVEVARGIAQHLDDDRWFHANKVFQQLNSEFSQAIRDVHPDDESMRPWFLGHIVIELLLDAHLSQQNPGALKKYYENMEAVDATFIQGFINKAAKRPTYDFVRLFDAFQREQFLFDYADDNRLAYRLNQVMKRVGLEQFDDTVSVLFSGFRERVLLLQHELLSPDTIQTTNI